MSEIKVEKILIPIVYVCRHMRVTMSRYFVDICL